VCSSDKGRSEEDIERTTATHRSIEVLWKRRGVVPIWHSAPPSQLRFVGTGVYTALCGVLAFTQKLLTLCMLAAMHGAQYGTACF